VWNLVPHRGWKKVKMQVTFLGTNGWYDTATGNTPCVLIETDGAFIVLDAGFGFVKVKDIVRSEKSVFLFITHLHLDHLIGLHTLPLFKFKQGISIYAGRKELGLIRSFLKRPFTTPPLLLPIKLKFCDIAKPGKLPFEFEYAKLRHSVPCYGYRFTAGGATVTYCTDTGLCSNLRRLAKDADLLIAESAMAPGDASHNLFHITPETAARVAAEAGAKRLALFHFDPAKYPTFDKRLEAEFAAKAIFANTVAANDGTEISTPICQYYD
jgi:ribonuclease BN (tRNA processing enzyme)